MNAIDLKPNDWNFSRCEEHELSFCCRYEYCRESESIRKANSRLKELLAADKVEPKLHAAFCVDSYACIQGFPEVTWLDLPKAEKVEYLQTVRNITHYFPSLSIMLPPSGCDWADWAKIVPRFYPQAMTPPSSSDAAPVLGIFSIQPCRTKAEIKRDFEQWLDGLKKPDFFKSGGRGGPADKLRKLGAWRVLGGTVAGTSVHAARTPFKAITFTRSYEGPKRSDRQVNSRGPDSLYGGENAWKRAAKAAEKTIDIYEDYGNLMLKFLP